VDNITRKSVNADDVMHVADLPGSLAQCLSNLWIRIPDANDHQQFNNCVTIVAELTFEAFELLQSLSEKRLTADYHAKRTILSILLETVRSNSENLEFSLRKPFNLPRDQNFIPLTGASGTPVELATAFLNEFRTYALNSIQPLRRLG
jgi:hypothetical protein